MDQAAAGSRPTENQTTRKEHHFVKGVACVVLEMGKLVVGGLCEKRDDHCSGDDEAGQRKRE
jgi:hypothetical protein